MTHTNLKQTFTIVESCEAGLQDRLNAKEAQGSSRNFENAFINKVPQSAFRTNFTTRGYKARLLSTELLKLELWLSLSGLVTVLYT